MKIRSALSTPAWISPNTIERRIILNTPSTPGRIDIIAWTKPLVLLAGLLPALQLAWRLGGYFWLGEPLRLGGNPAQAIEHLTGDWCLKFLLATLAISPLRTVSGWNRLIRFRRMLGLFAFFYGTLHLCAYIAFDQVFRLDEILGDITKRPFIMLGMASLVLMLPLAATSTRGWIKRLGGHNWNRLHKLVYPCAILGVAHYWWLVKRDITWPAIYVLILALLFAVRIGAAFLKNRKRAEIRRPG